MATSPFYDLDIIFGNIKSSWVKNTSRGHASIPINDLNTPFHFFHGEEDTEEEIDKLRDTRVKFHRRYLKILATTIVTHDLRLLTDNCLVLMASILVENDGLYFRSMNQAQLIIFSSVRKKLPELVLNIIESVVSTIYCGGDMAALEKNRTFTSAVKMAIEESFAHNVHPLEFEERGYRYDKGLYVDICREVPFNVTRSLVVTTPIVSQFSSLYH